MYSCHNMHQVGKHKRIDVPAYTLNIDSTQASLWDWCGYCCHKILLGAKHQNYCERSATYAEP